MVWDAVRNFLGLEAEGTENDGAGPDIPEMTAALLVEMAGADFDWDESEFERIEALLCERFELTGERLAELMRTARAHSREAVSLHGFTYFLKERLDDAEKAEIVGMLWEVALADGRIDAHEEHVVRKIAELLYVPHAEFIRLKHVALERSGKA